MAEVLCVVQKPIPGQLGAIYPRQPAAREPWIRGPWSPELLAPEQFPLIPELLVVDSRPGETGHIV